MAAGVKWYGPQVLHDLEAELELKLDGIAGNVVNIARASMKEPKSGKDYRKLWRRAGKKRNPSGRGKAGVFLRRSSAPGEAPAKQQARLINSIKMTKPGKLWRRVGTKVPYGLYLELGWSAGKKWIEPHPWLRPALDKERPHAARLLSR